jgi:hypothetical protein
LRNKARNDNHYYGFFDTLSNANLTFSDIFKIENEDYITALSDKKFIISQRTFDYYKSAEEKELKFLLHTLAKTFPH